MVKFLKPNKAVILFQGRLAGRKGIIVKAIDEGMGDNASLPESRSTRARTRR
ncbi:putative translation protein SH3 [Rosa chinensis]|uniref:Putative translation protein SH3 n=1 Tax=Rosa chinensis TaxID=74649 RepID=A0A2P6P2S6_ROSCH|nr:putative translation protein SH3 [Rosa chinensis]